MQAPAIPKSYIVSGRPGLLYVLPDEAKGTAKRTTGGDARFTLCPVALVTLRGPQSFPQYSITPLLRLHRPELAYEISYLPPRCLSWSRMTAPTMMQPLIICWK